MTHDRTEDDGRIATRLDDGIFHIVFDRLRKLNGFTPRMLRELAMAYTAFDKEPAARCALVSAKGAHFTAGLDLPKVAPMFASGTPMAPPGMIDPFGLAPPWRTKPVVFAVQAMIANARMALHHGFAAASAELVPLQARLSASADAAEGVRSFAEKRAARFTGS